MATATGTIGVPGKEARDIGKDRTDAVLAEEQVRFLDVRPVRKERVDRASVGRHASEHRVEGPAGGGERPARTFEVVRRQHNDAVVAVVAGDEEGAGDQVGGEEVMRDGQSAHPAAARSPAPRPRQLIS